MSAELFERLSHELARPRFHDWLRPEPVLANEDGVEIRLPIRSDMSGEREGAFVHGGIVAALVDLAGYAAVACTTGRQAPTVSLQVTYLRPAGGSELLAVATVRREGRRFAHADIEITSAGEVVALGRGLFSFTEVPQ